MTDRTEESVADVAEAAEGFLRYLWRVYREAPPFAQRWIETVTLGALGAALAAFNAFVTDYGLPAINPADVAPVVCPECPACDTDAAVGEP